MKGAVIMSLEFLHTEENGIKYLVHPPGSIFAGIKMRENHEDAFDNAIKRGMTSNPRNRCRFCSINS